MQSMRAQAYTILLLLFLLKKFLLTWDEISKRLKDLFMLFPLAAFMDPRINLQGCKVIKFLTTIAFHNFIIH